MVYNLFVLQCPFQFVETALRSSFWQNFSIIGHFKLNPWHFCKSKPFLFLQTTRSQLLWSISSWCVSSHFQWKTGVNCREASRACALCVYESTAVQNEVWDLPAGIITDLRCLDSGIVFTVALEVAPASLKPPLSHIVCSEHWASVLCVLFFSKIWICSEKSEVFLYRTVTGFDWWFTKLCLHFWSHRQCDGECSLIITEPIRLYWSSNFYLLILF